MGLKHEVIYIIVQINVVQEDAHQPLHFLYIFNTFVLLYTYAGRKAGCVPESLTWGREITKGRGHWQSS